MRWTSAFVLFVTALAAQVDRQPASAVTAVRHWVQGGVVRIAIEVSGEFRFRSDRLHNPERVYFDLADTRPQLGDKPYWSENLPQGSVVERLRLAQTTLTTTRVVLDLSGAAEISTVQLSNPNRLVIELRPANGGVTPTGAMTREITSGVAGAAAPRPEPAWASPNSAPFSYSSRLVRWMQSLPPVKVAPPPNPILPGPPAIHEESVSRPLAPSLGWVPRPPPLDKAPVAPASAASAAAGLPSAEMAKAARRTGDGDTSLVRTLGLKISRVVIDPGHGGHDQGTHGPNGLLEKDVVLDVSLRLGKMIEDKLGAQVIYTRTDDTYVPLEARTALANERKADLFLSIHGNSSPVARIVGTETYYLNFSDSRDALDVAARENSMSQKSISELHDLIQKISLHDKLEESREFATRIQNALFQLTARNFPAEHSRGVKRAPFVVLIGANMPSVLAEIGFVTNAREEALLRRPDYRQKVAEALFQGVSRYADGLSHFQVAARTQ
jgi:N-acetylmuramoyl-L-alanine amidase